MTEETTTWTIATIAEGESWACKFRTMQMMDDEGNFVNTQGLAPGSKISGSPSVYESWGLIETRDLDKQLVEIRDQKSNRLFVAHWDDCWDVDRAEFSD